MKRLKVILDTEEVQYNDKLLVELIMKYAPDWRRIINECQRNGIGGLLTTESLLDHGSNFSTLAGYIKDKDFKKMRSWVVNNIDTEPQAIFRGIYDMMNEKVDPASIPQVVLILADYQYKDAFVADHELNVVACLTELMAQTNWR